MDGSTSELQRKLGLTQGITARALHAPTNYPSLLAISVPAMERTDQSTRFDWLHAFYSESALLSSEIAFLTSHLKPNGQLWISWPKKTSLMVSDLSDVAVRRIGLAAGLVDVKVAAVDDTWSGLKFVYRLKDR